MGRLHRSAKGSAWRRQRLGGASLVLLNVWRSKTCQKHAKTDTETDKKVLKKHAQKPMAKSEDQELKT